MLTYRCVVQFVLFVLVKFIHVHVYIYIYIFIIYELYLTCSLCVCIFQVIYMCCLFMLSSRYLLGLIILNIRLQITFTYVEVFELFVRFSLCLGVCVVYLFQ